MLIVVGICLGSVLALLYFIYKMCFQLACGRTTRFIKWLESTIRKKKNQPQDPYQTVKEEVASWIAEQNIEEICIQGKDGVKLVGHFFPHPEAKRIILAFHGWRSTWDGDIMPLARGLYEEGSSLIVVEQRAHGASGGNSIGYGVLERYDCIKWCEYLTARFKEIPIYLVGVSMGATTVLMATELDLPKQVKGVIADCGFISPYEMVCMYGEKMMHLKSDLGPNIVNRQCKRKAGYDLKECTTIEAMKNCDIPVFFAHGTADMFVPYEMSKKNYEACASKKTLFTVDGAKHTKSFVHNPQMYMSAVKDFFQWK